MLFLLLSTAFASDAWLVAATDMQRFPSEIVDGNVVIATVDEGAKVEIVFDAGEQLRIRSGADFGWILATAVVDEAPAGSIDVGGLLDGLDLSLPPGTTLDTPPFPTPGSAPPFPKN